MWDLLEHHYYTCVISTNNYFSIMYINFKQNDLTTIFQISTTYTGHRWQPISINLLWVWWHYQPIRKLQPIVLFNILVSIKVDQWSIVKGKDFKCGHNSRTSVELIVSKIKAAVTVHGYIINAEIKTNIKLHTLLC